jgi:3,4-dihydroxy 2-butanone 4-phosphate synthase / GTP cyclohydrolase II
VPLLIEANDYNNDYLATKAEKLGHMLLQTYLVTVGITWNEEPLDVSARYDRLDKLRHLAQTHNVLLKEEGRPLGTALFGTPSLTFHLGFDQANLAVEGWYQDPNHPYVQAIFKILDEIAALSQVNRLEFLIANGQDPLTGLQMQLDRQTYPKAQLPSTISLQLELQVIYSFS